MTNESPERAVNRIERIGKEIKAEIRSFKEGLLNDALAVLTDENRRIFSLMYPKGPSDDKIDWAICQARYTGWKKSLSKNDAEKYE